jgi:dGTP triphosphohydrolase
VYERVDAPRARRAEDLDLLARQVVLAEDAVADRVVDVVVDVRDAVDDPNDLPLQRLRFLRARVREDPVADLMRQVELLRDARRLLVVTEAAAEARAQRLVERLLARVPERRVARVVAEADRLGEILGTTGARRIDTLVHDLVETSEREGDIAQGDEVGGAMLSLRAFMFDRVYLGPEASAEHERARIAIRRIFNHVADRGDGPEAITAFIAGMTDRFALSYAERLA